MKIALKVDDQFYQRHRIFQKIIFNVSSVYECESDCSENSEGIAAESAVASHYIL
ncbi:hypothetical protein [Leptospira interrogans]|uniref:hypothetical protein n=1 Tax=Leptospira interrogans TaxID=173 RepID=UPI000A70344C|nr:hypothetical protein [Leptospira interrogans]